MLGFAIGLALRWQAVTHAFAAAALLAETGDRLLLESGGILLLER